MNSWIPTRKQWRIWSLPSKLTAIGTLLGALTLAGYLIEKSYLLSDLFNDSGKVIEDVYLVLEFNNQNDKEISLRKRGEVFSWHPGGDGYHEIYTFEIIHSENTGGADDGYLVVPPNSRIKATAKFLPSKISRHYLEQGHMSISFFIRGIDTGGQFSSSIPFTKNNIQNAYLPIKLKSEQFLTD